MSTDTPEPVRKAKPSRRLTILRVLLGTAAFGLAILLAAWATVCRNNACPSLEGLADYDPAQASKVYAADGRLITDLGLNLASVKASSEEVSEEQFLGALRATADQLGVESTMEGPAESILGSLVAKVLAAIIARLFS